MSSYKSVCSCAVTSSIKYTYSKSVLDYKQDRVMCNLDTCVYLVGGAYVRLVQSFLTLTLTLTLVYSPWCFTTVREHLP